MVCDDCQKTLSNLAAPDAWATGGRDRSKAGENKLLRKGVRSNPYGSSCKVCKMRVQIAHATYCTQCAYGKGICAVCGKQVLDTTMYRMSEGGQAIGAPKDRDEAKFKSPEQIAREAAQSELTAYLAQTGQTGRMPTKAALEAAGQKVLAAALITSFGGLHAAADAMGLSKQLLTEEAEARKAKQRQAAMLAAEEEAERRAAQQQAQAEAAAAAGGEVSAGAADEGDDDDAPPPGVSLSTAAAAEPEPVAAAPAPAPAPVPAPPVSTDSRWQYDPNNGLYFQLSTQTYYDHGKKMYFRGAKWSARPPARGW